METVRKQIEQIIADTAGVDVEEVAAAKSFDDLYNFDSLDKIEATMKVEQKFNIWIEDGSVETDIIEEYIENICSKIETKSDSNL